MLITQHNSDTGEHAVINIGRSIIPGPGHRTNPPTFESGLIDWDGTEVWTNVIEIRPSYPRISLTFGDLHP